MVFCEPPDGGVGLSMHMRSRSRSLSDSSPKRPTLESRVRGRKEVARGLCMRDSEKPSLEPSAVGRRVRKVRKGETGTSAGRPWETKLEDEGGSAKSVDDVGSDGLAEEVDMVREGGGQGPLWSAEKQSERGPVPFSVKIQRKTNNA